MPAFNLRGVEPEVMSQLKNRSKENNMSVNALILQLIEQGLGYSARIARPKYHDLDSLAKTWSQKDAKEFQANTRDFEQIDEGLWK